MTAKRMMKTSTPKWVIARSARVTARASKRMALVWTMVTQRMMTKFLPALLGGETAGLYFFMLVVNMYQILIVDPVIRFLFSFNPFVAFCQSVLFGGCAFRLSLNFIFSIIIILPIPLIILTSC